MEENQNEKKGWIRSYAECLNVLGGKPQDSEVGVLK